jgi:hypothetical protein
MSIVQRSASSSQAIASGSLLDAQAANTNGVWQPLGRGIVPWSVTVRGTFAGTVTIYVSNQISRPLDSDNAQAVFQTITTPTSIGSTYPFLWIKAQVSGYGSGAITVDFIGGA